MLVYNQFMKNFLILFIIILLMLLMLIWPFMSDDKASQNSEKSYNVVVSNFALYDIVKHLSSEVSVENVMPFGSDIHTFEPTPKDIIKIKKADLFIYSGEDLEPWIKKFHFTQNSLQMEPFLTLEKAHHHHSKNSEAHEFDPHYWLDISNMIKMTEVIADTLQKQQQLKKEEILFKKAHYIKSLEQLDTFYKEELQNCKYNTIVTNHNAFEYLADRYAFKVKAISGLSPDAQSSARVMQELIEFVKKSGIKVLFFESFVSDKLIRTIAKESGVKRVETLFPLANVTQMQSYEGYVTLMKQNAQKISYALECKNSMVK